MLAVAPFLPALDGEFLHWDDDVNFVNNPHYRGLGWKELRWMFTTTLLGHWIPLTWVTFGINYVIGGMEPRGYHLANLLLHAGNAALLWLVAEHLLKAGFGRSAPAGAVFAGATVAALVFAVHPLRVESVAWVTERRDVLCAGFYLLAVLTYVRGTAESEGPLRSGQRALSAVLFAAALLSKASAMTLPLTLLLLDAYPLRRLGLGWRTLLREKRCHFLLAGSAAVIALFAVSRGAQWTGYESYPWSARLAMSGYSLWFYPWKLVWPEGLTALYELPPTVDATSWRFAVPLVSVACTTLALLRLRRSVPGGITAWIHSAIVLAPVSGIVHAGNQLAHDRYSYLSGLGFAVLAGAGVTWTAIAGRSGRLSRWVTAAVPIVAGLAILGWAAGTWRQAATWRNSETLWRAAVQADEACGICRNNLGGALMLRHPGDGEALAEAEMHLHQAILLRPAYPDPYQSLAALYWQQGRARETEAVLLTLARTFPALSEGPVRLAAVYSAQGRRESAIAQLREALRRRPSLEAERAELARLLAAEITDRVSGAPGRDAARRPPGNERAGSR